VSDYLTNFKNKFAKIEDIFEFASASEAEKDAIRKALTRYANKGILFRAGRGLYGFYAKTIYSPRLNEQTKKIVDILRENFPYLEFTITDTTFLSDLMNLQPMSTTLVIETMESAIDPIISALRKANITAYEQKDYPKMERYIKNSMVILVRSQMASAPSPIKSEQAKFASLEKILVDLVSDDEIFAQYQNTELENIYQSAVEKYAVNYSKLLKYAKARNRKAECISLLEQTQEYNQVRDLL